MKKNNNKKTSRPNLTSVAAIVVVGIFVVCVIFILAKGLFTNTSSKVPSGAYTGTKSAESSVAVTDKTNSSKAEKDQSKTDDSNSKVDSSTDSSVDAATESVLDNSSSTADSSLSSSSSDSSQATGGDSAYITQYAYLRTEAKQDGTELICMSPNIQVTVLQRGVDGYAKVTFTNYDGTVYEGYVHESYLSNSAV